MHYENPNKKQDPREIPTKEDPYKNPPLKDPSDRPDNPDREKYRPIKAFFN